ncbi:hypothetical protein C5B42_03895 [Candidatus Cerribacteria bacterium 'Amazon FNV 2010 28 9']|uniref:Uncharacterized protein n=1 Tax=Candidatus Cerribacteria bacterium 'Amazon FNV 2010 28 9' TaxID=2081795 RepID=A0A317JR06_9BACT|nr:MAG: hypothetical protein C5B42_03895 [Candidatus Cerribacteria bacterium 'Amazon FNV 2010 28 9']
MTKFQQYYQQMWDQHKDLLSRFLDIHDAYKTNRIAHQQEFNEIGKQARELMEEWDKRLCTQMEKGKNGVFSSKVSEKFWNEVKKDFPLIEMVGVQIVHAGQ